MNKPVRANRRTLRVQAPGSATPTVDILFDDHRVWSTKLPEPHPRTGLRHIPWPVAMGPYLKGASMITVRDSASGEDLASGAVSFAGSGRVTITDAQGRWLAMDKWNRLGPSFDGRSVGVQDRLLGTSVVIAEQMQDWGYPIYIVGGTLLGALRSGTLLPHDDDVDFAFWCDQSDPQEVSLVSFELERQLTAAGHTVVRHSHAHLELVFFNSEGGIDYYIDIFTGYHGDDGLYNQPFALHGKLPRDSILPVKPIDVGGVVLPGPAVPEAWLEFAYGPHWLVPDPSFTWETPKATLRRFENSYGVFNRQRVYWEKKWQQTDKRAPLDVHDVTDVERFLRLLPERAFVIDLGCGDGRHAERIAAAGHEVLGIDYSLEALQVARQTQSAGVEYRFLNLNDRHAVARFGLDLIHQGRQPYFFARDLLQGMRALGRADLFTLLGGVLDEQTFLYASFDVLTRQRVPTNPETWALALDTLRREAWRWELGVTVVADEVRSTPFGQHTNLTALIWR